MTNQTINIFFATNDKYVKYLDVAIISLLENASKKYNYNIVVLNNGLIKENIAALSRHQKDNVTIEFADVTEQLKHLQDLFPDEYYFTMASFYRLFIEKMYPKLDKAIYLDCDMIIKGDISKLYEIDLKDNLVGAVNEQNCLLNPLMTEYTVVVTGIDPHKYFNSGMLLLNLKAIREFGLMQRFLDMLLTYKFESPMIDQDYLNNLCRKRVLLLPNGWNYESVPACPLEGKLFIRHYAFALKPWKTKEVEYADLFWDYAKKSPFYDVILDEFNRITPQDLQREMAGAGKLLEMAQRLINSDHTFKKVIIDKEDK